jgi:serine/threonine protein phosphatase PrpC
VTVALAFDGTNIRLLTTEHTDGRAITRYFGQGESMLIEHQSPPFDEGDTLILLTDGVIPKGLNVSGVRDALQEPESSDAQRAADRIVQKARSHGSRDDITALVGELESW